VERTAALAIVEPVEPCAECGYSYTALGRLEIAPGLRSGALTFGELLLRTDDEGLRAHPRVDVWSALEYACHVRDLLIVQDGRVHQACAEQQPEFASMRRDERVLEERYNVQEPAVVSRQLADAADALALTLDALDAAAWERTGVYHWPTTAVRTVDWIGRHTVHEVVHHLRDIGLLLDELHDRQHDDRQHDDRQQKGSPR
jgi:hypothetical protein